MNFNKMVKKGISLLLITLLLISSIFIATAANDSQIIPPSTAPSYVYASTIYAYGGGDSGSADSWTSWKGASDGSQYILLPSSVNRNVYLWSSYSSTLTVTNNNDSSDSFTLYNGLNGPISIGTTKTYTVRNGSTYVATLKFKLSTAEGAIFVTTTDSNGNYQDNWNYICENKENVTKGNYVIAAADGTATTGIISKMKGRGNSTWAKSKKPFNINFDSKVSVLGMASSKKWSLLANYQDGSLMRNRILYDMADESGLKYSPESRFVDFYVNGSYKGSYQITERVALGKNNLVKITDLEKATEEKAIEVTGNPDFDVYDVYGKSQYQVIKNYNGGKLYYTNIPAEYNPADITGGYLLEVDTNANATGEPNKFVSPNGQVVTVKSPEYCTEAQMKYIFDYYASVEAAIYNGGNYENLIDSESFAKTFLVQDVGKNIDGGITSTFFYKDANQKMYAGPVWDFDCALGNLYGTRKSPSGITYNTDQPEGWFVSRISMADNSSKNTLYAELCTKPAFKAEIKEIWNNEFKDVVGVVLGTKQATGTRLKSIAEYQALLTGSADMNFIYNPLPYNGNNGDFTWIPCAAKTFGGQVSYISDWLAKREAWLSLQFGDSTTVYLDNTSNWSSPYAYMWNSDGEYSEPWPGTAMTHVEGSVYSVSVPAGMVNLIFSNIGNSQTADLVIPGNNKIYKPSTGTWSDYKDAPVDVYAAEVSSDNTTTPETGYAYFRVNSSVVSNPKIWHWSPNIVKELKKIGPTVNGYDLYRVAVDSSFAGAILIGNNAQTGSTVWDNFTKYSGNINKLADYDNYYYRVDSATSTGNFSRFSLLTAPSVASDVSAVSAGSRVKLTATAPSGGNLIANVKNTFYAKQGTTLYKLGDTTSGKTVNWVTSLTGTFQVYVTATDSYGLETVKSDEITITVN